MSHGLIALVALSDARPWAGPSKWGWIHAADASPPYLHTSRRSDVYDALRMAVRDGRLPDTNYDPIPQPPNLTLNFSHLLACTSCFEHIYRAKAHAIPFAPAPAVPELVWDDHAIAGHLCVARKVISPSKTPLDQLRPPKLPSRNKAGVVYHRFGMFGSVLRFDNGFHAWLGEKESYLAHSSDGLNWSQPTLISKLWGKRGARRWKELFPNLCVVNDEQRKRLINTHSCGNGRAGGSVCVSTSALRDGVRWMPLGDKAGVLTGNSFDSPNVFPSRCGLPCELASDSGSCIRWEAGWNEYRLTKRRHFEMPNTRWRAIRGVQIAANADIDSNVSAFQEIGSWYFDRYGKDERRERQMYSFNVARMQLADPDPEWYHRSQPRKADRFKPDTSHARRYKRPARSALYVGLASVLEWPYVREDATPYRLPLSIPLRTDLVTPYLLPTRDGGITVDLDSIYARQPLIPHGGCTDTSLDSCAFDHGYIQPASELLTVGMEHWLYYEGRRVHHHIRFSERATIALARWGLHRIIALVRNPRCTTDARGVQNSSQRKCGFIVTRPFRVPSARLAFNVDTTGGRSFVTGDAVLVEVLAPFGPMSAPALSGFGVEDSVSIHGAGYKQFARWRNRGPTGLQPLVGRLVRLRISLCGQAHLYSLTFYR